jgi:hypothetical protein
MPAPHSFGVDLRLRRPARQECCVFWMLACGESRPPPTVAGSERWDRVLALAETDCEEWPEDTFTTDLAPQKRRDLLRAWHEADPAAVLDVDARYATFAYLDRVAPEDVVVLAHLAASLRACGRWVDQRTEEDLVLAACEVDPAATRAAWAALSPPPSAQVWAAREARWLVEIEAPAVAGRFMALLLVGTQEWMAKWVLDGNGVVPELPENMPFGHVLREETRPPAPGVAETVARCTSAAPPGAFRVPRPEAAGVVRAGTDGLPRLWWPDDGVLGAEGPLGPVAWWDGAARKGVVDVGALTRVEHCKGQFHWEAPIPLGDAVVPGAGELGVALPPHAAENGFRLEPGAACGPVLSGPSASWALGCCG